MLVDDREGITVTCRWRRRQQERLGIVAMALGIALAVVLLLLQGCGGQATEDTRSVRVLSVANPEAFPGLDTSRLVQVDMGGVNGSVGGERCMRVWTGCADEYGIPRPGQRGWSKLFARYMPQPEPWMVLDWYALGAGHTPRAGTTDEGDSIYILMDPRCDSPGPGAECGCRFQVDVADDYMDCNITRHWTARPQ